MTEKFPKSNTDPMTERFTDSDTDLLIEEQKKVTQHWKVIEHKLSALLIIYDICSEALMT